MLHDLILILSARLIINSLRLFVIMQPQSAVRVVALQFAIGEFVSMLVKMPSMSQPSVACR